MKVSSRMGLPPRSMRATLFRMARLLPSALRSLRTDCSPLMPSSSTGHWFWALGQTKPWQTRPMISSRVRPTRAVAKALISSMRLVCGSTSMTPAWMESRTCWRNCSWDSVAAHWVARPWRELCSSARVALMPLARAESSSVPGMSTWPDSVLPVPMASTCLRRRVSRRNTRRSRKAHMPPRNRSTQADSQIWLCTMARLPWLMMARCSRTMSRRAGWPQMSVSTVVPATSSWFSACTRILVGEKAVASRSGGRGLSAGSRVSGRRMRSEMTAASWLPRARTITRVPAEGPTASLERMGLAATRKTPPGSSTRPLMRSSACLPAKSEEPGCRRSSRPLGSGASTPLAGSMPLPMTTRPLVSRKRMAERRSEARVRSFKLALTKFLSLPCMKYSEAFHTAQSARVSSSFVSSSATAFMARSTFLRVWACSRTRKLVSMMARVDRINTASKARVPRPVRRSVALRSVIWPRGQRFAPCWLRERRCRLHPNQIERNMESGNVASVLTIRIPLRRGGSGFGQTWRGSGVRRRSFSTGASTG